MEEYLLNCDYFSASEHSWSENLDTVTFSKYDEIKNNHVDKCRLYEDLTKMLERTRHEELDRFGKKMSPRETQFADEITSNMISNILTSFFSKSELLDNSEKVQMLKNLFELD